MRPEKPDRPRPRRWWRPGAVAAAAAASLLSLGSASCGAARGASVEEPMRCAHRSTLPARFCGASEDEALWRESNPEPVVVCNGCLVDEDCSERSGGSCVELPGDGCDYSAFVCVYPEDPCSAEQDGCEGRCLNRRGRAECVPAEQTEPE